MGVGIYFKIAQPLNQVSSKQLISVVVTKWKEHRNSSSKYVDPRDFIKLNKMSAKQGIVTAQEVTQFRSVNDARIPYGILPS